MKAKTFITIFLFAIFLASCALRPVLPAPTTMLAVLPTATIAPTFTPTPQNLADASDLSTWIGEFVHAYGGKVTVNGAEMDADQLIKTIKQNPEEFIQVKKVDGQEYSFFVVNSVPIGIRKDQDIIWQKAHLRDIVEIPGGIEYIGAEPRIIGNFFADLNEGTAGVYWSNIEPQRNQYDFTSFDNEVETLKEQGMLVRGHALVFPTSSWAIPGWLQDGNFTKAELEQIMIDHISTVVTHGKELGVTEWVVVNEPYIPNDRENDIFFKAYEGYGYIDVAFAAARKADPEAKLIYNDIDNHTANGYLTPLTKEIINRLRSETIVGEDGVARPIIDSVGIEGHLGDWMPVPDFTDVETTLKSYGLPIIITEFDYNLVKVSGSAEEKYSQQAEVYSKFLQAAINAGCTEFTIWSYSDSNNYLTDQGVENSDPGLFDKQGKPKMDYYAVLKVLYDNIP